MAMDPARFEATVARLQAESLRAPAAYQAKVALLALLGFGILALLVGTAGLGLLLLAGVAAAILFTGGHALVLLAKFGKLLFVLAVPLWFLVKSSARALFVRLPAPQGHEIARAQAPALFAALDDMRRRMRGPAFHHVQLIDEVNAAVMQRPLFGLFGFPRNHLLLGLPLLEALGPDEALAVVAHEYGHLAGSHSRFAAYIYRLRLTWATIQAQAEAWQGWAGRLLQRLVGWYAPWFNAYTFVLARANEYQADAASAELVGADAAARALKRVNLALPHYEAFVDGTFQRMRDEAAPPPDLALRWAGEAARPAAAADARRWLDAALGREGQSMDTHPVLRDRLAALPGQAAHAAELPAPRSGPSAAEAWLGAAVGDWRQRLQSQWAERVAGPWRERHEAIQARLAHLAKLRAQAERSPAEEFERLRLQADLEPQTDSLPEVAAFNAAQPDHAPALYLEGTLRLDRDDDAGLALLDRAMALDPDALQPGCERIYGWLTARGRTEQAQPYAERWRERDAQQRQLRAEAATLDPTHELRPHGLDADTEAACRRLLAAQGGGVASAWLARRVLPADPQMPSYVLALRLSLMSRWLGRQHRIVERLAAQAWPVPLFICTLDGACKPLRKRIQALPGARLPGRH